MTGESSDECHDVFGYVFGTEHGLMYLGAKLDNFHLFPNKSLFFYSISLLTVKVNAVGVLERKLKGNQTGNL